jgi:hypothetical protein
MQIVLIYQETETSFFIRLFPLMSLLGVILSEKCKLDDKKDRQPKKPMDKCIMYTHTWLKEKVILFKNYLKLREVKRTYHFYNL